MGGIKKMTTKENDNVAFKINVLMVDLIFKEIIKHILQGLLDNTNLDSMNRPFLLFLGS